MQGLSSLAYISPSQGFFHYYSDLIKVISAITIDYTKARFKITTMNPFKDYQENTVDRLLQNAYERQLEILLLADQEAEVIKKRLVREARVKIDEQEQLRLKKMQCEFKVGRSSLINEHRMRRIKGKYELCQKIFREVEQRIQSLTQSQEHQADYALFLIASITEGLVRMFQPKIYIRCLERDKEFITTLLPDIVSTYSDFMVEQVGREYPLDIQIAENCTLAERREMRGRMNEKSLEDSECIGGVILADETGNITLKSTLDCRINILREISLPMVGAMLWKRSITE